MNKISKSEPIIINIYNFPCDFQTELPRNDIINVIKTDTFQSKIITY